MAIRAKISSWVNHTAQAAYHYPTTRYGFSVRSLRPLTGKRKAGYFILGLGYSLAEKLNPFESSRNSFPQSPVPVLVSDLSPALAPAEIRIKTEKDLPPVFQMSAQNRMGGGSDKVFRKVRDYFVEKKALSLPEVSIGTEEGVGAVKAALDQLVEKGELGKRDERLYFKRWLEGPELDEALGQAKKNEEVRFYKFLETVDDIHNNLGKEQYEKPSVGDIVGLFTEHVKDLCGRKEFELLTRNPNGSLYLARGVHENRFRPAEQPAGYIKSILEGKEDFYDLTITGGRIEARDKDNAANVALARELAADRERLQYYRQQGVERIIFLRLKSSEQKAEGVMVFYNPVFFEAEDYGSVRRHFNDIANVTGKALGRRVQPASGEGSPSAKIIGVGPTALSSPDSSQARTVYDPENELKIWDKGAKHYDRRIEGQVDRNSRADVMQYLGMHIQEALDKASPEESVRILDLACGTGNMLPYILEKFKDQAHRLSIAMVDWSAMAIERAKARAERLAAKLDIENPDIHFEVADMVRLRELYPENTFDIAFSHMGFYAPKERVANSVAGVARVLKPGGYGTLDIMKKGGSLAVVKKDTISLEWRTKGWWAVIALIWKKIWSRAFGYSNFLETGFKNRSYFSPGAEEWIDFLKEQGLEASEAVTRETLADQFLLSSIRKPQ